MQPSIEVGPSIKAPLDGPIASDVAHDLTKIVSQARNLAVEIGGQRMQVAMAFAQRS